MGVPSLDETRGRVQAAITAALADDAEAFGAMLMPKTDRMSLEDKKDYLINALGCAVGETVRVLRWTGTESAWQAYVLNEEAL